MLFRSVYKTVNGKYKAVIEQVLECHKNGQPVLVGTVSVKKSETLAKMLQIYAAAFPEDEMQLELSDKQLPVNNGYYYLRKGKCMYSTERLPGAHIQMNISELTNRILQPLKPYMSLMLN